MGTERYHWSIVLLGFAVLLKLVKLLREVVQIWEEKTSFSIHFSSTEPSLDERQREICSRGNRVEAEEEKLKQSRLRLEIYLFGTKKERE